MGGILVLILLAGGAGFWWWWTSPTAGGPGTSRMERWVRAQLLEIADHTLQPEFTLESFEYEQPLTARFRVAQLVEADTSILEVGVLSVKLATLPRAGKPIVIEAIELEDATLRFVADADGSLIGYSNLVEDGAISEPVTVDEVASKQKSKEPPPKLSDLLDIQLIRLTNVDIVWEPPGEPSMRLTGLSSELTAEKSGLGTGGGHRIALSTGRPPLFSIDVSGVIDLDTWMLALEELVVTADLSDPEGRAVLPPRIQTLIDDYDARGMLTVNASGDVPLLDAVASTVKATLTLAGASFSAGDFAFSNTRVDAVATASPEGYELSDARIAFPSGLITLNGKLTSATDFVEATLAISELDASTLGGGDDWPIPAGIIDLDARVTAPLGAFESPETLLQYPATARLRIRDIKTKIPSAGIDASFDHVEVDVDAKDGAATISNMLFTHGEAKIDAPGRIRMKSGLVYGGTVRITDLPLAALFGPETPANGNVTSTLAVTLPLMDPASVEADGPFDLRNGILLRLPVVEKLVRAIEGMVPGRKKRGDVLSANVNVRGQVITLEELKLTSAAVAARGEGTIGFDQSLDLRLNAGPLEKLQDELGLIGNIFGAITDSFVKYRVTGTTSDPDVSVKPLGIGSKKAIKKKDPPKDGASEKKTPPAPVKEEDG